MTGVLCGGRAHCLRIDHVRTYCDPGTAQPSSTRVEKRLSGDTGAIPSIEDMGLWRSLAMFTGLVVCDTFFSVATHMHVC